VWISTLIFKQGYPCKDILKLISVEQKYPCMDISLQLSMLLWIPLWISMGFYGYTCMDWLWILDLGMDFIYTSLLFRALRRPSAKSLGIPGVKCR